MQGKRFRFGNYEADFELQELRKCGVRVGLQHKPFHLLELLVRNPGQLVTRKELFAYLWPDSHVSFERGLNSAMNSLRQVLGDSSRDCHYIETRPGLGYRFVAPIEQVADVQATKLIDRHAEAYQDCLKGRYLLDRMADEDIHKALAYFHSATGDKSYQSLAHAGISDAYCQLALNGSMHHAKVCTLARKSAELAIQSDPDLAQAHVSWGRVKMLFDWDWMGSRKSIESALELDPCSVSAHNLLASLHCTLGEYDAALDRCRRALDLDPLSFPASLQMAACCYACADYQSVVEQCWKMLSLAPSFAPAQLLLALAYEQLGMYEEAIIEFQNASLSSACSMAATSSLRAVTAKAGCENESEHASAASECGYWQAVVDMGRREYDRALCHLEDAVQAHDPAALWLRADARFHCLRELPRFQALLNAFYSA